MAKKPEQEAVRAAFAAAADAAARTVAPAPEREASVYTIKNEGVRARAFPVRGGVETVGPDQERTLELKTALDEAAIAQLKDAGFTVTASKGEAENARAVPADTGVTAAEDPAETGGLVPRSAKSEAGGVDRAPEDTTTTTKPTPDHVGTVA